VEVISSIDEAVSSRLAADDLDRLSQPRQRRAGEHRREQQRHEQRQHDAGEHAIARGRLRGDAPVQQAGHGLLVQVVHGVDQRKDPRGFLQHAGVRNRDRGTQGLALDEGLVGPQSVAQRAVGGARLALDLRALLAAAGAGGHVDLDRLQRGVDVLEAADQREARLVRRAALRRDAYRGGVRVGEGGL
jgi:hypothetical protein